MPLKTSRFLGEEPEAVGDGNPFSSTGRTTPHSQFRQLSLGSLLPLTETSLPQALSEQLADPMYTHAGPGEVFDRSMLRC